MHDPNDIDYIFFEQAERVRVGYHNTRNSVIAEAFEYLRIDKSIFARRNLYSLEAGHSYRCRVRAVSAIGYEHVRTLEVASVFMVRAYHKHAC